MGEELGEGMEKSTRGVQTHCELGRDLASAGRGHQPGVTTSF